ncbi:MAG: hypothetical protein FD123_625 [Bacteroidetes bacterium]|nr:MAG: hypothetical protein FD123_625 [Bacteroidota bacterium]
MRYLFPVFMLAALLSSCGDSNQPVKNDSVPGQTAAVKDKTIEELIFEFQEMIPDSMYSEVIMGEYMFDKIRVRSVSEIWDTTGDQWRTPGIYFHDLLRALNERVLDEKQLYEKEPSLYESYVTNYDPDKMAYLVYKTLPFLDFSAFKPEWKTKEAEWRKQLERMALPYGHVLDSVRREWEKAGKGK